MVDFFVEEHNVDSREDFLHKYFYDLFVVNMINSCESTAVRETLLVSIELRFKRNDPLKKRQS